MYTEQVEEKRRALERLEKQVPFRASGRDVALWQAGWKRVRQLEPTLSYSEWIRRALTHSAQVALR